MRDNKWLTEKLFDLWETNFNDVPRKNLVIIRFSKHSKRQLGCIKMARDNSVGISKFKDHVKKEDVKSISIINITRYFLNEEVPDYVVLGTIAHELCHYTHGFNSPLQQIYNHPHKGGIIRKEMSKRGLADLYRDSNKWLKQNWRQVIKNH